MCMSVLNSVIECKCVEVNTSIGVLHRKRAEREHRDASPLTQHHTRRNDCSENNTENINLEVLDAETCSSLPLRS